jgi:DNA-binding PadR family transcriptional regulator
MMRGIPVHRNLWALSVLCLLRERPMHPYEMQRLIRQRKHDEFLDLKRGSLYHAIGRLERAGYIAQVETLREGRRPERTIYRITEEGRRELLAWLRELLAQPSRNSIQFFAALSYLAHLPPTEVADLLESRAGVIEGEVASLDAILTELIPRIGRLVLLEADYWRAIRRAELDWLRSLIQEIRTGRLSWDVEAIFRALRGEASPPNPERRGSKAGRRAKRN